MKKVFYNRHVGSLNAGLILIAADTLEEALEIFRKDERYCYLSMYDNANWKELKDTSYNGESKVIIENNYCD